MTFFLITWTVCSFLGFSPPHIASWDSLLGVLASVKALSVIGFLGVWILMLCTVVTVRALPSASCLAVSPSSLLLLAMVCAYVEPSLSQEI